METRGRWWGLAAVLLGGVLVQVGLADAACSPLATSCSDLCGTSAPCSVTTCQAIAPGAVIDCSDRTVRIEGTNGRLEIEDGRFTLKAIDLVIPSTSRYIQATRSQSAQPFGFRVELSGNLDLYGYLEANDANGGGEITVISGGDIFVRDGTGNKGVQADATSQNFPGGRIDLAAVGNVTLADEVRADAGGFGAAVGGEVRVRAGGSLTVTDTVSVHGNGTASVSGQGGVIELAADAALSVSAFLLAEGGGPGGDGGEIHLNGEGITLNRVGTQPSAADVSAQGGVGYFGGQASGGLVHLEAGASGVVINMNTYVDVTGGEGGDEQNAGGVTMTSTGPITLASGVKLIAKSDQAGGNGGNIELVTPKTLTIGTGATLDVRGRTATGGEGAGADITLAACDLAVASGVSLLASGYEGGVITLVGRDTLTVAATADANGTDPDPDADGFVMLRYRHPGTCSNEATRGCSHNIDCTIGCDTGTCIMNNPNTQGATFLPAPAELRHDRQLARCQ
jgi:hypothetical protein